MSPGSGNFELHASIISHLMCDCGTISITSQAVSHRSPLGSDRLIGSATVLYHSTCAFRHPMERVSNSYNRHRGINKAISYSGKVATWLPHMACSWVACLHCPSTGIEALYIYLVLFGAVTTRYNKMNARSSYRSFDPSMTPPTMDMNQKALCSWC